MVQAAVLLLNASYEPLAVIPRRRAINLLMRDRVDAVSDETMPLRGVKRTWEIPMVMRLRRYVNVPRRGATWSRRGVLYRDGYQCIFCGIRKGESRRSYVLQAVDFSVDHIIPRSRGGRNTWGNTACACFNCNNRKGNRTPHEAGMPLRWEPKTPRVNYLVVSSDMPESWKVYLQL